VAHLASSQAAGIALMTRLPLLARRFWRRNSTPTTCYPYSICEAWAAWRSTRAPCCCGCARRLSIISAHLRIPPPSTPACILPSPYLPLHATASHAPATYAYSLHACPPLVCCALTFLHTHAYSTILCLAAPPTSLPTYAGKTFGKHSRHFSVLPSPWRNADAGGRQTGGRTWLL